MGLYGEYMLKLFKHPWIIFAIAVSAIAYYASTFGFGNALSPTTRYRIILGMLFAQSVGLVIVGASLFSVLSELRPYQRAASQLAILKGAWLALDAARKTGGVSPEARDAIYDAMDGAFGEYAAVMRNGEKRA